jgi:hypothetical protein
MNKRLLVGLAAAGIVGGATFGFAASLGGIDSDNLGADDSEVLSCDTNGVDASYTTTYDSATAVYEVDSVELDDVAAGCEGETIHVTLTDSANASLGDGDVVAGNTGSESVPMTDGVDAESVEDIHVVISGDS